MQSVAILSPRVGTYPCIHSLSVLGFPVIDQGELFDIPNPCQGVCISNTRGYCKGCFRSRQERFHWHHLSSFQKQQVINLCEKRRVNIQATHQTEPPSSEPQTTLQNELFLTPEETRLQIDPSQLKPPSSRQSPSDDSQIGLFDQPDHQ